MSFHFKQIEFDSLPYEKSLDLRNRILREPLGLHLLDEDLSEEKSQIHIGGFYKDRLISILILFGDPPVAKMRQVAVEPEFQGKGVGKAMAKFAEDWLRSHGFEKVYCHARDIAIPFYESLSYHPEGNTFKEIGIIHQKMVKTI